MHLYGNQLLLIPSELKEGKKRKYPLKKSETGL